MLTFKIHKRSNAEGLTDLYNRLQNKTSRVHPKATRQRKDEVMKAFGVKKSVQGTASLGGNGFAAMAALLVGGSILMGVASAHADNCLPTNGKLMSGQYVGASLVLGGNSRRGSVITFKQKGCELTMDSTNYENSLSVGVNGVEGNIEKQPMGRWVFDLSGKKAAIPSSTFIRANSQDPKSALLAQSLEVYTTMNKDGAIDMTVEFDVEHAGVEVRVRAEGQLKVVAGEVYTFDAQDTLRKFTGKLEPGEFSFSLVPTGKATTEGEPYAKGLAIRTGANWLFDLLKPYINDVIYELVPLTYFRK